MNEGYIPASTTKVRVDKSGKNFTASFTFGRKGVKIPVSRPDFVEQNQMLSALYVKEKSKERRGEIAHRLYTLDLPLFKEWDLFENKDRADYKQDAFLWVMMALETYNPEKGSFIHWLRNYINSAKQQVINANRTWFCVNCQEGVKNYDMVKKHKAKGHTVESSRMESHGEEHEEAVSEDDEEKTESLITLNRLKESMSPERWNMIEMKVLKGMTSLEVASATGLSVGTTKKRIEDAVEALRCGMVIRAREERDPVMTDGSEWMSLKHIAQRMRITYPYVKLLLSDATSVTRARCKHRIDPRDYSPVSGGRIRFKETKDGGIIYPRLIERPKIVKKDKDEA